MRRIHARFVYFCAAIGVVILGLLWRSEAMPLSSGLKKYGGIALWALMIYAIVRFLKPETRIWCSAATAIAICVVVELGQLYHAPWIDALRQTRLGALALGSVFNWPDMPAYGVGVVLGAMLDYGTRRTYAACQRMCN